MPLVKLQRLSWQCDRCGAEVHTTIVGDFPKDFVLPHEWKLVCDDCASLLPAVAVAGSYGYRTVGGPVDRGEGAR